MGPWLNVLDPGFNLHLREDLIASAWIVRKPTADGVVSSLELFDAGGCTIAMLFGERHAGQAEQPAWRALLAQLRRRAAHARRESEPEAGPRPGTALGCAVPARRRAALGPGWAAPRARRARRLVSVGGALTEIVRWRPRPSWWRGQHLAVPGGGAAPAQRGLCAQPVARGRAGAGADPGPGHRGRGPAGGAAPAGAAGVPVAVLAAGHRFEGLCERVQRVGELTGRGREAAELVQRLQQDWSRARSASRAARGRRRACSSCWPTPRPR
jgi:hypothetical protein